MTGVSTIRHGRPPQFSSPTQHGNRTPGRLERREVTGWRAIALALAAQVLAISLQTYAFFHEVPRSERILTVIVLVIATIQIVVSRPRPRSDSRAEWDPPGLRAPVINPGRPGAFEAEENPAAKANQLTEPEHRSGPVSTGRVAGRLSRCGCPPLRFARCDSVLMRPYAPGL